MGGVCQKKIFMGVLADKCLYEATTLNGIQGGLFIAPSGGKIFLPFAGRYSRWDDDKNGENNIYIGEIGYYWSSTIYRDDEIYVGSFSSYRDWSELNRDMGLSVRPVKE